MASTKVSITVCPSTYVYMWRSIEHHNLTNSEKMGSSCREILMQADEYCMEQRSNNLFNL